MEKMILTDADFKGSLSDRPEYLQDYGKNESLFLKELEELNVAKPDHAGWFNSLFNFEIYRDVDGYRIALPSRFHPVKLKNHRYFENYLLSRTVFPNQYQARAIAVGIMRERMGN
jgi:hypothetical protein